MRIQAFCSILIKAQFEERKNYEEKVKSIFKDNHRTPYRCLVCSPFTKAYADDTVDSLEKQTNGLQNQLDSLNQDLTSLSAEITDLASKIEDTDASVQKAELDLAAAKLDEQLQYDAMKKRIK